MYIKEMLEKTKFESCGKIVLNNEEIEYKTICEDNVFVDEENNPTATIFSYAYFRTNVENTKNRPVLFAFNGGPGSSSLWIHAGLLGPRRVKLEDELHLPTVPPFELEDNPHCLLDFCDIVILDCIGTGFSRLLNEKKKEDFYDTDKDVSALALCIEQWLNRYGRRNSPVFLMGESYGTGRAALLVGELLGAGPNKSEILGISVSGVMLLGSTFFKPIPAESSAVDLLAMAAAHQYHNKPEVDRNSFIEDAWNFVKKEYVPILFEGDAASKEAQESVANKLEYFTGINQKYWLKHRLRMDTYTYSQKLLEDDNKFVGFYDSRYTWSDDPCLMNSNVIADDPAMGQYTPAFQAAFALMKEELNITFDRVCKGLVFDVNMSWNRDCKTAPKDSLASAMRRNPKLHVFFASGLYDLCTTAGHARYLATHSNLDLNRVKMGEYPSGHMAYLGEESATLLGKDMRAFFMDLIK